MNIYSDTLFRCAGPRRILANSAALLLGLFALQAWSATLNDIQFAALPGDQIEIDLIFSGAPQAPTDFATQSPARIALDFPGVTSKLPKKSLPIGLGVAHSLVAIEASDRTRVVLNLNESVPYQIKRQGNRVVIALNPEDPNASPPPEATAPPSAPPPRPALRTNAGQRAPSRTAVAPRRARPRSGSLRNVDFRRGNSGEGRVLITLPNSKVPVAVREEGRSVIVDISDTGLPQRLFRRLDVTDFATPVVAVEARPKGSNVEVTVRTTDDYDYLAYQTDDLFTLEFRRLTAAEKQEIARKQIVYSGDRLSLNFQDIEVRAVLQLLADFTGLNLIASDTVAGNVTLRLKNVPWDQALDIILKSKGLSMRQNGNVIMVAPTQEIAAQEKLELESKQQIEELAPIRSEFIQVNYAKAEELMGLIKTDDNNLLSERGNVTYDQRTNTLLVQDTSTKLEDIRRLVGKLDVPVRQVMIESRIVIANNDFARDIGVRFGVSGSTGVTFGNELLVAGGQPGNLGTSPIDKGPFLGAYDPTFYTAGSGVVRNPVPFNSGIENPAGSGNDSLLVNLPATAPSGAINFLLGKVGSHLIQLELSAMQREGRGEIISSPRVITSDQKQATIKVGQEIPFTSGASANTPGNVSFKEAVLKLDVTPHITPDGRVIMDLEVTKDNPDFTQSILGNPPIDRRAVNTTVLVENGETVVLGGVYERTKTFNKEQVPWFGDLPVIGYLFKRTERRDNNEELLIFVTPKILKTDVAVR